MPSPSKGLLSGPCYLIQLYKLTGNKRSAILFTRDNGKINGFLRGKREHKAYLEPFAPLWHASQLSRIGQITINSLEQDSCRKEMIRSTCQGPIWPLYYINVLIKQYLPDMCSHRRLYDMYQTITGIGLTTFEIERMVAMFELLLLEELGYALPLNFEVSQNKYYAFHPETGFEVWRGEKNLRAGGHQPSLVPGNLLAAIKNSEIKDNYTARNVSILFKKQISWHLADLPPSIKSIERLWR